MTIQIFKRDKKNNEGIWRVVTNNQNQKAFYFPFLWNWEVWIKGKPKQDEYRFSPHYWLPVIDIQFVMHIKNPKTGEYLNLNHYEVDFCSVRNMTTGLYLDMDKQEWITMEEYHKRNTPKTSLDNSCCIKNGK